MINGPYDVERAYLDHINQHSPGSLGLSQAQSYPPGAGPSAHEIAQKQAFIERDRKAQRGYELSQMAQQLDSIRLRLLDLDFPAQAKDLDTVIVELMKRWLDGRWQP